MSFMFTAAGGVWIICHSCQGLIRVQMCVLCSLYMSVIAVYMYVVCIIVVLICNVFYWVYVVFLKLVCVCLQWERFAPAGIWVPGTGRCSPKRRGTGSVSRGGRPPQTRWRRWQAAPRKAPPRWSSRSRATACSSAASTRRPWPATAKPSWVEEVTGHLQDIWRSVTCTTQPVTSSNSQQYTVWVKMISFSFMPKIIWTISKDHVQWRGFVNVLP